jgi:acetylornithine/N-succinyldiaminopimelate aminotransferase
LGAPLIPIYNRAPVRFAHGAGVWLTADDGQVYLDCVSGVATNALGHCHPALVDALQKQARRLWHVSNMFSIAEQELLATRLLELCFASGVFFCNSGTEAVEFALKAARRFHFTNGTPNKDVVVGFEGSFHGRTYASLNASGNRAYLEGFGPELPGYRHVAFGDMVALEEELAQGDVAAVIAEPVQGEGGARAFSDDQLRSLRRLCSAAGSLLIHDEIQCGMGRTGRLFAHQWVNGAEPDIMAVAKALGCGFPVGACLVTEPVLNAMPPGSHGSTFGGNPLAMSVAVEALTQIATPAMFENVENMARLLREGLVSIQADHPHVIADVRGKGLLIGVQLNVNNREFMARAREKLLLVAGGGDNCVRLLPPLNINADEAQEALSRLRATAETWA